MFANRLKNEREKKSMSQVELADKLGISKQTIYKYEKGIAMPSVDTLLDIATIFDCSMDYLFGRTDNRNIALVDDLKEETNKINEIENELHRLLKEIKKIKK